MRSVPAGTLALFERARRGGADGPLGGADEVVLVSAPPGESEVGLELLEPALAALLRHAADGCPRTELLAAARQHGAEPGADEEIVARLTADHLLV